jgi:hypothetical protein
MNTVEQIIMIVANLIITIIATMIIMNIMITVNQITTIVVNLIIIIVVTLVPVQQDHVALLAYQGLLEQLVQLEHQVVVNVVIK